MGRYTQEFKAEAIALAVKSHRSHQEIALDLGIESSINMRALQCRLVYNL